MIHRPALRYYGGKWRLAKWIIGYFPPHDIYVEPFSGAASVLLQKAPSEIEVLNDIDGELVNFFKMLRDRQPELTRLISLTPFSQAEYRLSYEPSEDPLEQARRYYVRSWQGFGGFRTGWRRQMSIARGTTVVADWNNVKHLPLVAARLKQVFVESQDALEIIEHYDRPGTLFYVDPPYLPNTAERRRRGRGYAHDIDEGYHNTLLELLVTLEGNVVLSGYHSETYDNALPDWTRFEKSCRTMNVERLATEVLWVSPSAMAARQSMLPGLTLTQTRGIMEKP